MSYADSQKDIFVIEPTSKQYHNTIEHLIQFTYNTMRSLLLIIKQNLVCYLKKEIEKRLYNYIVFPASRTNSVGLCSAPLLGSTMGINPPNV